MLPSVHAASKRQGIDGESARAVWRLILLDTSARALSPSAGGMGRVLLARILFRAPLVAVALVLLALAPAAARAAGGLESAGKASPEDVFDEAPAAWTEIGSAEERIKVFEFLAKRAQGNYENIRTWRGTYSLALRRELRGGLNPPGGRSILPRLPDTSIQEGQYIYTFTVDQERNAVFWESKPLRVEFRDAATGKRVGAEHLPVPVERKIYTPERFLEYWPDQVFQGFVELPGRHELRGRRRALRTAVSEAVIFDPQRFFNVGLSQTGPMWEDLARDAAVLRGEHGERLKRKWEKGVRLYQAASDKGQWFCREFTVSHPNGEVFRARDVFSSAAGFLVTEFVSTCGPADRPQEARIQQHIRWKYRQMGGIFVPAHVLDINRVGVRGEGQGTVRLYTLVSCEINPPVDAAEFDWAGLGMAEGTVVLDKVEGMAYIWQQGKLTSLGRLGEAARPGLALPLVRWGLALLTLCAVVATSAWLWRRRRVRC